MLPALATVEQLALEVDEPIASADPRAEWLLSKASTLVRAHTGRTWVDAEGALQEDIPDAVTAVTVQCAARVWRNPAGAVQEAAGGLSWRLSERAGDGLFLTDAEKAMLGASRPTGGLWKLSTTNVDPFVCEVERDRWEAWRFRDVR